MNFIILIYKQIIKKLYTLYESDLAKNILNLDTLIQS